jgi:hypothetical protein
MFGFTRAIQYCDREGATIILNTRLKNAVKFIIA